MMRIPSLTGESLSCWNVLFSRCRQETEANKVTARNRLVGNLVVLSLVSLVPLLGGCASGPAFERVSSVPADKALIYVYRSPVMHGAAYTPEIRINDHVTFPLVNGGYVAYFAPPGEISISITNVGTRSINFTAGAGQDYYIKGGTIPMGLGIPSIELMSAEAGLAEVRECKRLPDVASR